MTMMILTEEEEDGRNDVLQRMEITSSGDHKVAKEDPPPRGLWPQDGNLPGRANGNVEGEALGPHDSRQERQVEEEMEETTMIQETIYRQSAPIIMTGTVGGCKCNPTCITSPLTCTVSMVCREHQANVDLPDPQDPWDRADPRDPPDHPDPQDRLAPKEYKDLKDHKDQLDKPAKRITSNNPTNTTLKPPPKRNGDHYHRSSSPLRLIFHHQSTTLLHMHHRRTHGSRHQINLQDLLHISQTYPGRSRRLNPEERGRMAYHRGKTPTQTCVCRYHHQPSAPRPDRAR